LYNISKGRLDSNQANSYAHYAALGYRLWGVEARPVYRERHPLPDMDATLRFLDEAASPWENLGLMASLAHPVFFAAWWRVKILHRV